MLGVGSIGPAFAAGDTVYHGRGIDWMHGVAGGIPFDATDRYATSDGSVAYCLNLFVASPGQNGTYYPDQFTPSQEVIAALYYGYPNHQIFGGISLTDDQARAATQFAVWAMNNSGYGDQLDLNTLMVETNVPGGAAESQKVIDATRWLSQKALGGLPNPAAQVVPPTDTTPQPYNDDFRRIGPFSLARSIRATVSLSTLPKDAYLGDVDGNQIQGLTDGSFYLYLPVDALTETGSGTIQLDAEFNIPSAVAYTGAPSLQNVGKYVQYVGGNSGTFDVSWFAIDVVKQDKATAQPVADTVFSLEQQDANGVWQPMDERKTDQDGKIVFPGLGAGTWQIREIRTNPAYASCGESGEADVHVITIGPGAPPDVQIFKNDAIMISCQVDKDTIQKTSAAYRALPGEEDIDNVGVETYRYNVDYRSTSSVAADEFTVDDSLESVSEGKIRIRELWTPVCYGDIDGKMNIWYRTNKTDDSKIYSPVSAMETNPHNPNNPNNQATFANTGWVLWAQDVSTDARTHLTVSDLGLSSDEYITALRYEHGAVLKGFTTKNYESPSQNGEHRETQKEGIYPDRVNWTPVVGHMDYCDEVSNAQGLKPVSYLVHCPLPLDESQTIKASACAQIARNLTLTDRDEDVVYTVPISTFTLKARAPEFSPKSLGHSPNTGDGHGQTLKLLLIGTGISALTVLLLVFALRRKAHSKIRITAFVAMIFPILAIASSSSGVGSVYAISSETSTPSIYEEMAIPETIVQDGFQFQLIDSHEVAQSDKEPREVFCKFTADCTITASEFHANEARNYLPSTLTIEEKTYQGSLLLLDVKTEPCYASIEQKADRTEVLHGITSNEISGLPEEKTFELLSDSAPGATSAVVMKRAGVHVTPISYDEDGLPELWDATIVYRALESYLEPNAYTIHGVYAGSVTAIQDSPVVKPEPKLQKATPVKTIEPISQPEASVPQRKIGDAFKQLISGILTGEPRAIAIGIGAPLAVTALLVFLVVLRRKMKRALQMS
ncbi:MAG: Cys-Gln thioester bond-forming surface protein [Clostridiales Family XIII bacterium]|nr:Cys-Gln thioester bond-forming surface protein [Clostridiales Family XIII bacterium]